MKRVAIIISYDGTNYAGFQIQKNALSIEEVLNSCLSELLKEEIHIIGASRTDAGVHALGNVAVFDTETKIPAEKIAFAVNTLLPEDIRIQKSYEVENDFHPRYNNSKKTYEYKILNTRIPIPTCRNNTYFYHRQLDVEKMQEGANYLLGEHDFQAFCSANAQVNDTYRTIYSVDVKRDGDIVTIRICGNGFLYNMVRIVTGSLLAVGSGTKRPQWIKEVLDSRDRQQAGTCAPAVGLTLINIEYEPLADQLLVQNDLIMYGLWQKEITEKRKAYLTIFLSDEDELEPTISRLTKKTFRYGAKYFYVRHAGVPDLSLVCKVSKNNKFKGKEFFTAGDYRYTLYGEMWQMDRDLRANPADISGVSVSLRTLTDERKEEFIKIYNKCFFSVPCSITLDETALDAYMKNPSKKMYFIEDSEKTHGIMVLSEDEETIEISAMGIIGTSRRKGHAIDAIELVADMAHKKNKKRVTLQVFEKNKKAVALYIKTWFYRIRSTEKWYETIDAMK